MVSRADFVTQMYQAGLAAGLTDAAARVMAAQAALESDYGNSAPGNNFFGIKAGKSWTGPTQLLTTHEVIGGKSTKVKDNFRVYATPEEGIADRVAFMQSRFPDFNQAATVGDALDALRNGRFGKYYTALKSDYEGAVSWIDQSFLGGSPIPPGDISGGSAVGSELDVTPAGTYTIRKGDTLGKIAAANGTTVEALAKINGITDPNKIVAGRSLALPAQTAGPALDAIHERRDTVTPWFNLAPPDLPLNPTLPPGRGDYWGPETGRWAPQALADAFLPSEPAPIQLLDSHANEVGGLVFSSVGQSPQAVAVLNSIHDRREAVPGPAVAPPQPMPGRPATVDAKGHPEAPAAPAQTITVGKHSYRVGDQFEQGGFRYTVTPSGIDKMRISSGEKTIVTGVIKSIAGDAVVKAAPQVKKAITNASEAATADAARIGATLQINPGKVLTQLGGFASGLGQRFGFGGPAPANGIVTEHIGEQNGRPVIAVSGSPVTDRASPPQAIAPSEPAMKTLSWIHDQRDDAIFVPKNLTGALSATPYATVGAAVDQHFSKPDPVLDTIHDKREAQQQQATEKAPAPSQSIVKPQSGTVPEKPAPKPAGKSAAPGTSWFGDFPEKIGDPIAAPAKLEPPAQRETVTAPQRPRTVTVTVPNPAYIEYQKQQAVGSVNPRAVSTLQDIHDKRDAAATLAQSSEPVAPAPPRTITQVKTLPPVAPAPVMVQQPTVKTAGAPTPVNDNSRVASPIYVDKATGARLTPTTISVYDNETQRFTPRVVYRPVAAGASAAPSATPSSANSNFANTSTIGQQQNDLNKQLGGSSRNDDGTRGFM